MKTPILIIPGLGGSSETHWQSLWHQKYPHAQSVIQDDWNNPIAEQWIKRLDEAISQLLAPTLLVAHSLGAITAVHWAAQQHNPYIIGALLVAPADVDSKEHAPEIIRNFAPIPLKKLYFPSILITSSNDPYISVERATILAKKWGSQLINIGHKGHINTESNLGIWEEGLNYLESLEVD